MSDRFHPISMEQLTHWVFTELDQKDSLFNIPRAAFFVPRRDHRFRLREHGVELDTPFGVAAGPQSQMAQNIVAAWLAGARVIELKTIQTLDQLDVNKPCIDVTDEGYNVEWSQELRVHQSFDEYLRAWVLIHALHRRFGWPGETPGFLFNMSVGYNLEGILAPNVQWYFAAMTDASAWLPAYLDIVARYEPGVLDVPVPARLSDTITLSTMHGCPPDEIERISEYLLVDKGLHTSVKCNPTLLGPELVRTIVNDDLGFGDVPIPDAAFGHDLKYVDAVPMFRRLQRVAADRGLGFGLKLSNTLEVENWRTVFDRDPTMYLSGRPLHAVTANLALRLSEEFDGGLPVSFAGGADAFNAPGLLRLGDAHDHGRLGPAQDRRLPAAHPVHGEDGRGVRRTRSDLDGGLHRPLRRGRRICGCGRRRAGDGCGLRRVQPARLRAGGATRLAVPQGLVPDGPIEDGPRARGLRLHQGAVHRHLPGRPGRPAVHGRGPPRRHRRGDPDHPRGQSAAVDPRPGLRPPVRVDLRSDAPGPAAGDPAHQAVHHGPGDRRRRSPDGPAADGRAGGDHRRRPGRPGGRP